MHNSRPFSTPDPIAELARGILSEASILKKPKKPAAAPKKPMKAIADDDAMEAAVLKVLPKTDLTRVKGYISWSKRGGYAGEKMLERLKEKLMGIGFKKESVSGSNSPDGSTVGFGEKLIYKPLGWSASFSKSYGSTASSNSYSVTVQKIKTQ
jgi:hypothetical protein